MGNDLTKKVLVVDNMASNKSVIKFTGDAEWYDVSQKVQGYDLVKYGIVNGATADVTFDAANQVIYLKKKEGAAPAATQQTSAPATTEGDTKMWTVKAVAKNKKVIKFEESSNPWDNLSPEVEKLDLKGIGIVPKAKVLVTFDGGGIVTAISLATVTPEPPPTSTDAPPSNTSNYSESQATSTSIEKQVALKESGWIIRSLIEKDAPLTDEAIVEKLKKFTKAGLEAMNQ